MEKKSFYLLSVVAVLLLIIASCNSKPNYGKKIIGSWVIDSELVSPPTSGTGPTHSNASKGQKWTFNPDGKFSVLTGSYTNTGNYSLSNIDTNYFLNLDNGKGNASGLVVLHIVSVSENKMVFDITRGMSDITFYLSRK